LCAISFVALAAYVASVTINLPREPGAAQQEDQSQRACLYVDNYDAGRVAKSK